MKSAALAMGLCAVLLLTSGSALAIEASVPGFLDEDPSVKETAGSVTLQVGRDTAAGSFVVNFQTRNAEARAGSDYQQTSGQLAFADGDAGPKSIQVTIINDTEEEDDETFLVVLTDGSGAQIGVNDVEIVSDEKPTDSEESDPGSGPGDSPQDRPGAGSGPAANATGASPTSGPTAGAAGPEQPAGDLPLIVLQDIEAADDAPKKTKTKASGLKHAAQKDDTPSRFLRLSAATSAALSVLGLAFLLYYRRASST